MFSSLEKERDRRVLEHIGALRKGFMCGICNGFLRDAYNLPCGHNFCQECVNNALAHKNVCPDCKNPAWQKDTLKAAQADSTVQDWVTVCEAGYQALVARVAEDDGDESDSMFSEGSSRDEGDTKQHQLQEEGGGGEKAPCVSNSTVQQPSLLPEEKAGGARATAAAKPSRPGQVSNGAANVNDVVERHASFREAVLSAVVSPMPLATAPTLAGASAKPTTVARYSLEQQEENVASLLRRATPAFPRAAVTPGAIVEHATWSPWNEKGPAHVRFQRLRRDIGSQLNPQNEEREEEKSVHKENRNPGASMTVDGLSSAGRAGPKREDVEVAHGSGASQRPEVRGVGQAIVNSTAIPPPVMPATGMWYQRSPPPRSSEKSCSTVASRLSSTNRGRQLGTGEARSRYSGTLPDTCDVLGFDSPPYSPAAAATSSLIGMPPLLKISVVERRGDGGTTTALEVRHAGAGEEGGGHGGERSEGGLGCTAAGGASSEASSTCLRKDLETPNGSWHSERQGSSAMRTDGEQYVRLLVLAPSTLRTGVEGDGEAGGGEKSACLRGESETRNDGSRVKGSSVGSTGLDKRSGGEGGHTGFARVDNVGMSDRRNNAAESDASQGEHEDVSDAESLALFVGADGENDAQRTPSRDVAYSPVQRASPGGVDGGVRADGTGGGDGGEVDEEEEEETCDEAEVEDSFGADLASPRPANATNPAKGSDNLQFLQSSSTYARPAGRRVAEEVAEMRERAEISHQRLAVSEHGGGCEKAVVDAKDAGANFRNCETHLKGRAVAEGEALSSEPAVGFVDTRPADGENAEGEASGERGSHQLSSDVVDVVDVVVAPSRSALPREEQERSQASETPTQSVTLHDESYADGHGDGAHHQGRNGCDEGLRVRETVAQTVDAPAGVEEGSAVALLGVEDGTNGEVVASTPPAQSFLMSGAPARGTAFPSQGVPESVQSDSQVQETPVTEAVVQLGFGERNEAVAPSQHQEAKKASEGDLDTQGRSLAVAATKESTNVRGERASTDRGGDGIGRRQSVPSDTDTRQTLRGGASGLGWDPPVCGRLIGDSSEQSNETVDGQDVPETVPPGGIGEEAERCGGARGVLCLATQEASGRDEVQDPVADEGVREADDQGRESRRISETASQPFSTQEVRETAEAYESSSRTGLDDSHDTAHGERESATARRSWPPSEVVETPQLRGTPTQGTAGETIGTCDGEGCKLKDAGSTKTAPSTDQGERFGAQGRGGSGCAAGSPGVLSPKKSRLTPASPLGTACGERSHSEVSASTEKSPGSGSRKRSVDSAPSPATSSRQPGNAGKRPRVSPTEKQPSRRLEVSGKAVAITSSSAGMSRTEGTKLGPPLILRGGSGSGESGDECESEVYHDLAAAQDAWEAEGGYGGGGECSVSDEDARYQEMMVDDFDSDGDGDDGSVGLPPIKGGQKRPGKPRQVVNPYTPIAHLELQPDYDPTSGAAETADTPFSKGSQGNSRKGRQLATGGATAASQSSRPSNVKRRLRRPSAETMGFGAPSGIDVARGPSGLDNRSVDARMREKHMRAKSNKILAAGRGNDWGVAGLGGSFSHSLGPDTEDVAALAAGFAKGRRREGGSDTDTDNDKGVVGSNNSTKGNVADDGERLSRLFLGDREGGSTGRKRPRGGKATFEESGLRRTIPRNSKNGPVLVLLDCDEWEVDRAKQLCEKLGQRRLHTSLVRDATHVVLSSRHTLERSSDNSSDNRDEEGRRRRHEVVVHGIEGYLEAVMLGLWVVDMSWVETCLHAATGSSSCGGGNDSISRRVISLARAPPRDFELVGCLKQHKGCEPRRGRIARGLGVSGVFGGLSFCVLGPGRSELEKERLERLLKLGEGVIANTPMSSREDNDGGWTNEPFSSSPDNKNRGSGSGWGGGGGAAGSHFSGTTGTVVVVVVMLSDRSNSGVSRKLAEEVTARSKGIGAKAIVVQDWILRSVENGAPVDFDSHPLPRLSSEAPLPDLVASKAKTGTPRGANNDRVEHPRKKSSLSLTEGGKSGSGSRQREVVDDVGHERINRGHRGALDNAERQESELMREAQKVVDAKERLKKEAAAVRASKPPQFGADNFEFTRIGSSNKQPAQPADGDKSASAITNFTDHIKVERVLWQALHDARYLRIPDEEGLGRFWMDKINDGFLAKISERWEPTAKERGCPFIILEGVYEGNKALHSVASKQRLNRLLEEFDLWEAPTVEASVDDTGKGRAADDPVELL